MLLADTYKWELPSLNLGYRSSLTPLPLDKWSSFCRQYTVNAATIESLVIDYVILHFNYDMITYPYQEYSLSMLVKRFPLSPSLIPTKPFMFWTVNKSAKTTDDGWYIQIRTPSTRPVLQIIFYMMRSSNGNTFHVTGPLCGEFNGHQWIPLTKPVIQSFDVLFDLHLNKRLS